MEMFDTMKIPGTVSRRRAAIIGAFLVAAIGLAVTVTAWGKNAISYNKDGWEYLKKEQYRKAIFSFKNALNGNPRYREALIGMAKAYFEVEAYDQSFDLFTSALALDAKSVEANVGLGRTLTATGNYTGAIKYFDRARRLSPQNIDARYGTAYVYHCLGKKIWAKRALETILRMDPYHYDSLLLMAEIKSNENRLREARRFLDKAIDSNNESSRGHIVYGEILLREYLKTEDDSLLDEATESLGRALSIQPGSYQANRMMGYISLLGKKYDAAAGYFGAALKELESGTILYSQGVAHDRAGDQEAALEDFMKAIKKDPSDSIIRSRFEDFLIMREYKIGHPMRVMLNREHFDLGVNRMKKNLPDQAIMYLRRSLLMNPMNVEARELLMDYYNTEGYYGFYIEEMKEILRLNPDRAYQERLGLAIMKRRDLLSHREGYSSEEPPRDVPVVLVLNFDTARSVSPHPDAGEVIANHLSFVLGQYGRMKPVGIRARGAVACSLMCGGEHLETTLESVEAKIKSGDIDPVDYIVYGTYYESGSLISIECSVLDYRKGFLIGQFTLTDSGKESLPMVALRSAKRLYDIIPFKGRVLKLKETGIVTNLGLFDGMKQGEKLVVYKAGGGTADGDKIKKKIIFTIRESDTLVSYAEPQKVSDLERIDSSDVVYPLKKRRAKKIE